MMTRRDLVEKREQRLSSIDGIIPNSIEIQLPPATSHLRRIEYCTVSPKEIRNQSLFVLLPLQLLVPYTTMLCTLRAEAHY